MTQDHLRGYWPAVRDAAGELHVANEIADGTLPTGG